MKSEFSVIKVKVIPEMIGRYVLLTIDEKSWKELKTVPAYKKAICIVTHGGKHNLERHDLFWACISIVAENMGLTDRQVVETCKIDCKWYEGFTHYKDKHGKDRVNVMTKSIKFSEMTLAEADEFYSNAFNVIAGYINIPTEQLVQEAKKKMNNY